MSAYRALSRLHHPDVGGSSVLFRQIQAAYEQLEDKDQFEYWKARFLQPKRDQVKELQAELATTEETIHIAYKKLVDFLRAFAPTNSDEFNVFNLPPCVILVSDVLEISLAAQKIATTYDKHTGSSRYQWLNFLRRTYGHRLFDIEVGSGSKLIRYPVEKMSVPQAEHNKWPPRWCSIGVLKSGKPAEPFCWSRTGEAIPLPELKLVGSIRTPLDQDEGWISLKRLLAKKTLADAYVKVIEGFQFNDFETYLPYLEPRLRKYNYVVAAKKVDGETRFFVLGRIVEIALRE